MAPPADDDPTRRPVRTRVHPARRAAAARLLDQACRNIVHANHDRRRLLYRYAGTLGLFGNMGAVDPDEAGARLLAALHESGWPGPNSSPQIRSPKSTVEAAYRWARKRGSVEASVQPTALAGDRP